MKNSLVQIIKALLMLSLFINATVYEDGLGSSNWKIYDNRPSGARVTTIEDNQKGNVISLRGSGIANGFKLGSFAGANAWNNSSETILKWSMKATEDFIIMVAVDTTNGRKFLKYKPVHESRGYMHGLEESAKDGTWRSFERDIVADLRDADSSATLLSINGFYVRGSLFLDDIELFNRDDVTSNTPSKVYAFFADEHNTQVDLSTGEGRGNRILQIDLENMSLVNELSLPGILGHHADYVFNSKIYGVPKGSNFVNVIKLSKDSSGNTYLRNIKQIQLPFKPRSGDAYNAKYNLILMVAANRPMGALIDVGKDEIVTLVGEDTDCILADGTTLLSHVDANTPEGALKYHCALPENVHGGTQISGHPYWLTSEIFAIIDRANKQISTYRLTQTNTGFRVSLLNRVQTNTSVHQIVPRDRRNLPDDQKMDFYAVEEGEHVGHMDPKTGKGQSDADYAMGKPHALIHLRLTNNGLELVRRMYLQRPEPLSKEKSDRIMDACAQIVRSTFYDALNGPSQEREDRYNELFRNEGITRSPDQEPYNDLPVDCFYPGIPGGHNADFAPNNRHLYIGMAGGAMSIVDVNKWKIVNNVDILAASGPGHTCFSKKHNVALSSNHGLINNHRTFFARTIKEINSERPRIGFRVTFPDKRPDDGEEIGASHSCYVDESGDYYYNFFSGAGVFYKVDMYKAYHNPMEAVVDSLEVGGTPIQGSYIKESAIEEEN